MGTVTEPESSSFVSHVPEITFKTDDGKTWELEDLLNPDVTIIAFETLEGKTCAFGSMPIMRAAKKLKEEGIPVIEIS
jgi:peroxiredoxin